MLIPVILAGGSGSRLWPESRRAYPKPFMRFSGGESLLRKTLRRAAAVADADTVVTVVGRDLHFLVRDEYAGVPGTEGLKRRFILEPEGRNTAPAAALAALQVRRLFGGEARLLILPADHLIEDLEAFAADVARGGRLADQGHLVTFGIAPRRPETGYGYLRAGAALPGGGFEVERFVEKPDKRTAEGYLGSGRYAWNGGIFLFSAEAYLDALERYRPTVLEAAAYCFDRAQGDDPLILDAESFRECEDISIDYAVMEKSDKCAMVQATFDWNDVGSWKAVSELESGDADGNRVQGRTVMVDTQNCCVRALDRLVATVGVRDLVIVETADAVLVADRERSQDVRAVVERLDTEQDESARTHRMVRRPWGSYTVLEEGPRHKVKRLRVLPGEVLSLQQHARRSEHWTVVAGRARITLGEETRDLDPNESAYVPAGTRHRLENPGTEPVEIIEVQCGDYLGEDDIVRFEDRYGRV